MNIRIFGIFVLALLQSTIGFVIDCN